MADSRQTKVVTYELQGNTTNLEQALSGAISTLNALDQKLTSISTKARMVAGKDKSSFKRASAISVAESQLTKLQQTLGKVDITNISPDQLNMLKFMGVELDSLAAKLNKFKREEVVTQKAIDEVRTSLHTMNYKLKQANITTKQAVNYWQSFRNALNTFSKYLSTIQTAISYFERFYNAASDFIEVMNLFNVATGKSKDSLLSFATSMAEAYGTDISPILNAIATFRQYGNTIGFAAQQADILSEGLTQLTYDMASMYNVDYADMMNTIKSGLAGQTKSLMRYGISVHQATLEQTAMNIGLQKSWSQFSETEKVALRYISIMEQASLAQGDLARTLESPSNQMKILKSQLTVLLRNLGKLVVTLSQFVLPIVNALFTSVNKFLDALTTAAGFEIEDYSDGIGSANQLLEEGTDNAEEYADALKGTLAPLDEINQQGSGATSTETGFGTMDPKIIEALQVYDNLTSTIGTHTSELAKAFSNVFNPELFKGVGTLLKSIFDIVSTGTTAAVNILKNVTPILEPITTVLGKVLTIVATLLNKILAPFTMAIEGITSNIWLLVGAFAALNLMQLAVTGNFQAMAAVKIISWFKTLTVTIAKNTAALLTNVAAAIKAKIASAAMAIAKWWEAAAWWQQAIAVIASAGALALIVGGIVLAATSSAKSQADSTMASTPNVPQMARGGVVTAPTVALIGEGRYNEAVVPLGNSPQFRNMQDAIAEQVTFRLGQQSSRATSSRSNTPVILQINGKDIARAILPDLGLTRPQTGVKLVR